MAGSGIVLPGGANIYYLDLAPHSDSPMVSIEPPSPTTAHKTRDNRLTGVVLPLQHRTPSTDYVIVLRGELTVVTPAAAFDVVDGKGSYGKVEETVARAGDVVVQRGSMHA